MNDLNLGAIGNSTFGALIDKGGRVVWACFPRFDGDPLFCHLLNDGNGKKDDGESDTGFFDFQIENFSRSEQHYLHNTAILVTTLFDSDGAALEITDFAPRFKERGRVFRPVLMIRRVRPISGHPRVRVRLRPSHSYNAERPQCTRGSNHIRYVAPHITLRCTTDAPVSFIDNEVP
ncbi:MAG TPA: glycoside hydrolase family 15 protein, partial [Rhodospirillales bacterium]|nr:glycoside hydrolase family 15 protein [Rhodospirillales bacterium]